MSATTQNSIMHLLVGKDVARTASATATDPAASTYLADGEIAVVDLSGTVLNTTTVASANQIRIIQSQGASLPSIQSPVIELSGVKSYKSKAYAAAVQQIDYVGFDAVAVTGDIEVINSNGYEIMVHDINSAAYGSTGVDKFGFYVSDSTATKSEINDGLAINLHQNIVRVTRPPFTVVRVSSATFIVTTGTTGNNSVFTNGSKVVTGLAATTEVPVGTYIRVGTTPTTTLTLGIYKVVAATSTTITLDQEFQGTSGTYAAAAIAASILTSTVALNNAAMNASSLGIKLAGKAEVFTSPQSTEPYLNRWITTARNAGSTTVTAEVAAVEGIGIYSKMASLEYFLLGNEGFISRNDIPYVNPRANVLAAGTYHLLSLEWDSVKSGQIFNQQANSKQLLLAFNFVAGSAPTSALGAVTAVQDVLNVWINSNIGQGALA
jgi:hypothetical protein